MQFDGNLWAGNNIIPGDPRCQNRNGKYFEQFLSRNSKLTVVNSLSQCEGLITRSRNKNGILEESILDFFVVCDKILPFVEKMVKGPYIDQKGLKSSMFFARKLVKNTATKQCICEKKSKISLFLSNYASK